MNLYVFPLQRRPAGRTGIWLAAILGLVFCSVAVAESLADGLEAYRQGDYSRAMELWRPLAEQGDPEAVFYLSRLYAEGRGTERDEKAAIYWLKRSASLGYAPAQFNLGNHYHQGTWVPEVQALAIVWWRRAAKGGYARAQYNLGRVYYYGAGVDKDKEAAIHWFHRAVEGGSERAREALETLGLAVDVPGDTEGDEVLTEQEPAAEPVPESKPKLAAAGKGPNRDDWIRSQPPDHFTFQLFASKGEDSALRYLKEWQIPDPVALCGFRREGTLWIAVVWGSFADNEQASKALDGLPSAVRKDVWLRRFRELHALLAENPD